MAIKNKHNVNLVLIDSRVTNLEKCYDSDLNLVYLQGKRDDAFVAFIPVLSSQPLNLLNIENIQKFLKKRQVCFFHNFCVWMIDKKK